MIAAGQGMAAVLLAACGLPTAKSPAPEQAAASESLPQAPMSTGRAVTAPPLSGATASPSPLLRSSLGVTPVYSSAASPTAALPPSTHPMPPTPSTHTGSSSTPTTTTPSSTSSEEQDPTTSSSSTPRSTTTSSTTTTSTSASTRTSTTATTTTKKSGLLVYLDPGHNGGNESHPEIINAKIDGGYGYTNVCNTTGTETNDGYAEHQFTWNVANYMAPMLRAKGIEVRFTRDSDTGVGPCTNVRAQLENQSQADAVVSIHGDGVDGKVEGFYVLTATRPPAGDAIATQSLQLARALRDAMEKAGFPPSNTLGSDGLWTRDDLTGLNKSTRPKILIECGNMRNAEEAGWMSSTSGQKRYAAALVAGTLVFLGRRGTH